MVSARSRPARDYYMLRGTGDLDITSISPVCSRIAALDPTAKMPADLRVGIVIQAAPWRGELAFHRMARGLQDLKTDQGIWHVTTTLGDRTLDVAADLVKHVQLYAKIDVQPSTSPTPLTVNDKDIPLSP